MKSCVIAFVGISGVGKSTMLKRVASEAPFKHLQASQLIKDELARMTASVASSEELRTGPVADNQQLLVSAFARETTVDAERVVIDGHTVVDTPDGLTVIPPETFALMGVTYVIVLQDAPIKIIERRRADASRARPERSPAQLAEHQARSFEAATQIGLLLNCPVTVLTPSHGLELISILARQHGFPVSCTDLPL